MDENRLEDIIEELRALKMATPTPRGDVVPWMSRLAGVLDVCMEPRNLRGVVLESVPRQHHRVLRGVLIWLDENCARSYGKTAYSECFAKFDQAISLLSEGLSSPVRESHDIVQESLPPSKTDRWLFRLKNHKLVAVVVLLVGGIVTLATVKTSVRELLEPFRSPTNPQEMLSVAFTLEVANPRDSGISLNNYCRYAFVDQSGASDANLLAGHVALRPATSSIPDAPFILPPRGVNTYSVEFAASGAEAVALAHGATTLRLLLEERGGPPYGSAEVPFFRDTLQGSTVRIAVSESPAPN